VGHAGDLHGGLRRRSFVNGFSNRWLRPQDGKADLADDGRRRHPVRRRSFAGDLALITNAHASSRRSTRSACRRRATSPSTPTRRRTIRRVTICATAPTCTPSSTATSSTTAGGTACSRVRARSGKRLFQERLGAGTTAFSASPVAETARSTSRARTGRVRGEGGSDIRGTRQEPDE